MGSSAGIVLGCVLGSIFGAAAILLVAYAAFILYIRGHPQSPTSQAYSSLWTRSKMADSRHRNRSRPHSRAPMAGTYNWSPPRSLANTNKPLPSNPRDGFDDHLSTVDRREMLSAQLVTVDATNPSRRGSTAPLFFRPASPYAPLNADLNFQSPKLSSLRDPRTSVTPPSIRTNRSNVPPLAIGAPPEPPQRVATRLSGHIDDMIGASVNNGTIVVARPPVEAPRPAPPIPTASEPYRKDPLEHTRHISQPSLHASVKSVERNSAHNSLDEATLPHTLLLDDCPNELEAQKHQRKSRIRSIFGKYQLLHKPPPSQKGVHVPESNHASPNTTTTNLTSIPGSRGPSPPELLPPLEFNGLNVSFSNLALEKAVPQITPQVLPRGRGRFMINGDENQKSNDSLAMSHSAREFDFELSSACDDEQTRPLSQTSSLFSGGYQVALSATFEDLREAYRDSSLNLAFHTKDEYQQLTEPVLDGSDDGSASQRSGGSSVESTKTITLGSPIQLEREPSAFMAPNLPGSYEVKPLIIAKRH